MTFAPDRPAVLAVMTLPPFYLEPLRAAFEVYERLHETDPQAFARVAPRIRAITGGGESHVPLQLMQRLPALEVVSIMGVGYDRVDVQAALERRIPVTHTPDVLNDEVADLAIGLMLSVARRIPQADRYVREGRWATQGNMPLAVKMSGAWASSAWAVSGLRSQDARKASACPSPTRRATRGRSRPMPISPAPANWPRTSISWS
jgi:hydroxypyruvate reductase